ncbi:MAG TPA: aldo/keto reductase, partial [Chitinophagaceae bacterium]|nr:aldo/keto reductase [Chitinophagaceae bacterium]
DSSCGWPQNFSYDVMRRHIEASLEHLGLSQLFLEQLHCIPTAELKSGQVFKHLRAFQEEGLIRHWGVSVETSDEALLCLEQDGLSSLQVIFNLFRQHVADEFFAKAAEKGVAIIVRVPLASGLLTGKFTEDTKFQESDHRHYNAKGEAFNAGETFSGIDFHEGIKFSRQLAEILPQGNMPQAALRWILDHKEVTTVIPGASSVSQARSNLAASDMQPLKPGVHQQLRQLYNDEIRPVIRGHY